MKNIASILAAVLLTILIGCSKTNPAAQQSNTGTLQIKMIDSPAGYDQVNIVVDSVQAHISSSDSLHGWTTLNRTSATYDLLKLVNGANAVIGTAVLPVGRYSQIRLYIGSGSTIVVNGVSNPLITPSGSQSGVKLNMDATIQADIIYVLTIDFDANKSVVVSGGASNPVYSLKPVIRVVATGTTGNISGIVSPALTLPTIWAYGAVDTFSTSTDATGGFKLMYLNPGMYYVFITPKDTLYRDTLLANITVTPGATTNLGTIILVH